MKVHIIPLGTLSPLAWGLKGGLCLGTALYLARCDNQTPPGLSRCALGQSRPGETLAVLHGLGSSSGVLWGRSLGNAVRLLRPWPVGVPGVFSVAEPRWRGQLASSSGLCLPRTL